MINPPPKKLEWTPELVERFWNGFAQTRLTELGFARMNGRSVVISIEHCILPDKTVLDFGAGDGDLVRFMCERGAKVAAFEPSQERARRLEAALAGTENFLGAVGPDTTVRFDCIVMSEVIEHVLDAQIEETLRLIHSLLKPDGILIVTTPNNEDLELGMAYCPVSNTLFHRWQHVRSFTQESLPAFLAPHGFENIATHRMDFNEDRFIQFDPVWGCCTLAYDELPFYIRLVREGRPCYMGTECTLLYFGRRKG